MKILITTDLYAVTTNGVVTSINNLRGELEARGHEVRILTFSENVHSHKDGNVYYIRSMPFVVYPNVRMPLTYRHRLVRELVEWGPDVIHSQCEFFSYQFTLYVSKRTGAPIVHTCHTMYEDYTKYVLPGKKFGKFMVRQFMSRRIKKVDAIIAPTKKVEETLRSYGLTNRIDVVPSGIDLGQHKQRITAEERAAKRAELGYNDDTMVLINLGRLGTEKRTDELITFMSTVREKYDNVRLLIVGDGPARGELEALTEKLGLGEYVHFTGMVAPTEVQAYYQLGDVFVSASTSEAQGLTYVEASANGLPLLCREDQCVLDVIRVGESGFAYTSLEDFMEKLDKIMTDSEWRERASASSREIADSYDKSNFGASIERVYEEVIAASKAEKAAKEAEGAAKSKK